MTDLVGVFSYRRFVSYSSSYLAVFVLGFTLVGLVVVSAGCNAIRNSWLDPTTLGAFDRTAMLEIRTSLTLEDTPPGIPGALHPSPADLMVRPVEYLISPGDTLAVEIYELRQRLIPYQAQAVVSMTGYVNLPVIGRVQAAGLTVPGFEAALVDELQEQNVLVNPEVTVNPMFLQKATYSIFGIGVSAANDAPLRAGTFPIRRPDLHVLEAINLVGGLNEFITEVYVFRYDNPPGTDTPVTSPYEEIPAGDAGVSRGTETDVETVEDAEGILSHAPEDELIEAVVRSDEKETPEVASPAEDVVESLEPEPTQPFIWVNGAFIENPAYQAAVLDAESPPTLPSFDTVMPAINWARIAGETAYRVIRIPADLLRSGDPEVNIIIRAGDVIRIVSGEIGVYYVMGQVNRVGAFAFNAEPITVKAAIAAAGGLSGLAWPDRCTVYRRVGQREQMIQVDLDRIFAGKDPDFFIRRGDIINVGTHPFAPFLQRIRAWTLPNPINNAGYSFTYARNYADIDSYSARLNPHNEPDRFPALFP